MIRRLLLALHPRGWRREYGAEFALLLAETSLSLAKVIDVLINVARQHARAHPIALRLVAALLVSVPAEVVALHAHITANILWLPTTRVRTAALLPVVLSWLPVSSSAASWWRGRPRTGRVRS